jgi:hypothetical protein
MTIQINSEKSSLFGFTEAALAELGILAIVVLVYDITKSTVYAISPNLYRRLVPLREILSLRGRQHHTEMEG